ncbi:hypothetical protein GCM10010965_30700 [Caldalkalibacillus thermarum]|uniref:hypothetical protein n=1 Tax=Caldalkalibacillus thermarum TaxID=296745 RepID=UPI0016694166|nr:hypothetical protein [Caldalkalibacillus thermarum]GGK35580.1 hypothetical protein GCM10010965_30700 [Caldalkalibacillus thermarum]
MKKVFLILFTLFLLFVGTAGSVTFDSLIQTGHIFGPEEMIIAHPDARVPGPFNIDA